MPNARSHSASPLKNGYIGFAPGLGLDLYAALPKKQKPFGRRLALLMIGTGLLMFMGVVQSEDMQIEV